MSNRDILIELMTKNFRGRIYGTNGNFVLEISTFENIDYKKSITVVFDMESRKEVFDELKSLIKTLESRFSEELKNKELYEVIQ
jgi:hypothetical protein